jgi:hypothetical protein
MRKAALILGVVVWLIAAAPSFAGCDYYCYEGVDTVDCIYLQDGGDMSDCKPRSACMPCGPGWWCCDYWCQGNFCYDV